MNDSVSGPSAYMKGIGWGWILAYGIISIVIGVLAILWPFSATLAVTLVIGAFFIATGIASLASGIGGKGHETRGYEILFGIMSVLLGCLMAFQPMIGAISLTLTLATWLGIRGAMEIYWGFRIRRHRWLLISMGVINILLDIFLLVTLPTSAVTLPGFILAISFIYGGIVAIMVALGYRSIVHPLARTTSTEPY